MRKPRVIIFDDEPVLLELLEFCFVKWGYEVFSYRNPVACPINSSSCASCRECPSLCADLVISDFQMPQMTGIELFQLQEQRGCRIDRKMKAIMSGHTDAELLKQCGDLGYRFFEKPFDCSDFKDWRSECERHFDLSRPLGGEITGKPCAFKQETEYCNSISPQGS